jgi:O-antigen/teichoic acid export membrane protein
VSLRQLARASALYTFGNLAPKVGAFLLLPIYVHFLTQAEFGTLAIISSLSGLLGILYRLGLDGSLMRLHFDLAPAERHRLYGSVMVTTLAAAGALSLVAIAVLAPAFRVLFPGVAFVPLGLLGVAIALSAAAQFVPATLFRATGQAGRFVTYNFGGFVLVSVLTVVLVVAGFGVGGILVAQLTGALILFGVAVIVVGRLGPFRLDMRLVREAFAIGLPLVPHAVSGWALRLSDRWLIPLFIALPQVQALAAVGSYSLGYQLGYVVSLAVISVNAAWSPWFFRIGRETWGPDVYREMLTVVMAGTLMLAVGISVVAREVVDVMASPAYAPAADVLPVVAFASVAQGMYVMFSSIIFLAKATGRLALFTLVAALLNVTLNVILIPRLGIMGAAWSTLAAYLVFASTTYLYGRTLYPLRIDVVRLSLYSFLAVLTVAAGRLVAPDVGLLAAATVHVAMAVAFAAFGWLIIRSPIRELRSLMRNAAESALA